MLGRSWKKHNSSTVTTKSISIPFALLILPLMNVFTYGSRSIVESVINVGFQICLALAALSMVLLFSLFIYFHCHSISQNDCTVIILNIALGNAYEAFFNV